VNDRASNYITESSAAFADLGTFLPLMLGLVVVAGMDPVGLLYGFGLFALFTAAVYRRPIPVQPMKAAAAMGIAGLISADVLVATAIMIGVVLIVLSQTQSIEWLKRLIPKTVLHGMRLALAVSLIITAVGMVDTHWFGAGIILCLLLALQRTRLAGVSCALVLAIGWFVFADETSVQWSVSGWVWPQLHMPVWDDFEVGLREAVLPQLALTLTNALILTAVIAKDYFPNDAEKISEKRLAMTSGLANLFLAPFGAMPMCHGAGGLAAHRALGSITGLSVAVFGVCCLLIAGLFGQQSIALLAAVPSEVLVALVVFAAWVLADPIAISKTRPSCQLLIICMVPVSLVYGLMVGLIFGILAEHLRIRFGPVAGSP
jgi:MFS superfamily sulfate permease-like transporter